MGILAPTCGSYGSLLGLVVSASCIFQGVGMRGAPYLSCSSLLGPGNPRCPVMLGDKAPIWKSWGGAPTWELGWWWC